MFGGSESAPPTTLPQASSSRCGRLEERFSATGFQLDEKGQGMSASSRHFFTVAMAGLALSVWAGDEKTSADRKTLPSKSPPKETRYLASGAVHAVQVSPSGSWLAIASENAAIRLCSLTSKEESRELLGHRGWVYAVGFFKDETKLASCGADNTIRVWDLESGEEVGRLAGHEGAVTCLALSPDGQLLASGSYDSTVRLWQVATGKELQLFRHRGLVTCISFSPNGNVVASGSYDNTVRLWDPATGREIRAWRAHESRVYSLAFSPDSSTLASGGGDKRIRLWDFKNGHEILNLKGHEGPISCVTFSPDGRTLASAGGDGRICLWEIVTGQLRVSLAGHKTHVSSLHFSRRGDLLASSSWDKSVKLWQLLDVCPQDQPTALRREQLECLWNDLASEDAPKAYEAARILVAHAEDTVSFLGGKMAGDVPTFPADRIARLISDLDDDDFTARENAAKELREMGRMAEIVLRRLLQGDPSPEVRRQVETLVAALSEGKPDPGFLRAFRALEILESIATNRSVKLLKTVSQGSSDSPLVLQARASLGRLSLAHR